MTCSSVSPPLAITDQQERIPPFPLEIYMYARFLFSRFCPYAIKVHKTNGDSISQWGWLVLAVMVVEHQEAQVDGMLWLLSFWHNSCNPSATVPPPCDPAQELGFENLCKVILANQGPFAACHGSVPPQSYLESCVYDQCATAGNMAQFCQSLEAYAAACELQGVALGEWRNETQCGKWCC